MSDEHAPGCWDGCGCDWGSDHPVDIGRPAIVALVTLATVVVVVAVCALAVFALGTYV